MSKKEKIIGIITIFSILICIIIIACIILLSNKTEQDMDNESVEGEPENYTYYAEKVRSGTNFFSIEKCIQNNVEKSFKAKEMNMLPGDYISSFGVYGEITESVSNTTNDVYYIFRIDYENETYSIEKLEKDKYSSLEQINLETNIEQIENKGNNIIEFYDVDDEDMCRYYYKQYSKLELEDPEKAYQMLDEDYKKERFSTFEEFQQYINSYKNVIEMGIISKYSVDIQDDYTEYVIKDDFNNIYKIKEESIMNYKIMLDDYTIKSDEYVEKYNELKNEEKVQANAQIFLKMINTKDYKHAYGLLNNEFKQNKFETQEKFEKYIKENFFEYNIKNNSGSGVDISQEGGYYIYNMTVSNNSSSVAENKKITFIIKLKEGTDFEMSFSM